MRRSERGEVDLTFHRRTLTFFVCTGQDNKYMTSWASGTTVSCANDVRHTFSAYHLHTVIAEKISINKHVNTSTSPAPPVFSCFAVRFRYDEDRREGHPQVPPGLRLRRQRSGWLNGIIPMIVFSRQTFLQLELRPVALDSCSAVVRTHFSSLPPCSLHAP